LTIGRILALGSDTVYYGNVHWRFRGVYCLSLQGRRVGLVGSGISVDTGVLALLGIELRFIGCLTRGLVAILTELPLPTPQYLKIRTFPKYQIVLFFKFQKMFRYLKHLTIFENLGRGIVSKILIWFRFSKI
jgi:hypothetical protein